MPYNCENCLVGILLQNVHEKEKLRVPISKLQLFACESDADDPSKAWIACMIVVCRNDRRSFDMWGVRVAVAKVVILCCILGL